VTLSRKRCRDTTYSLDKLRLNPTKSRATWLGSSKQVKRVSVTDVPVLSTLIKVTESVRDLNCRQVIINIQLSLSKHGAALWQSEFFPLRQLQQTVKSLIAEALISCCLDYCNPLRRGTSDSLVVKVLNAVSSNTERCSATTLRQSYRYDLTTQSRTRLMHQSWSGQTPAYTYEMTISTSSTTVIVIYSDTIWVVPCRRSSFRDRSFGTAGLRVWNGLPPSLRQEAGYKQFKRLTENVSIWKLANDDALLTVYYRIRNIHTN